MECALHRQVSRFAHELRELDVTAEREIGTAAKS